MQITFQAKNKILINSDLKDIMFYETAQNGS